MRHYVAYNKTAEWGAYDVGPDDDQFGHWSGKPVSQLEKMIGQRIWVISGTRVGGKMRYELCSVYIAEKVLEDEEETPISGRRMVAGTGMSFAPPIVLKDFEWFQELYKEQNQFSFGLNQIRSEQVIRGLESLREGYEASKTFRSALDDLLEGGVDSDENLPETTREALIESRIGQGYFRHMLIGYWGGCAVTGCREIPVLRASHIKPWRDCSNEERLDLFNGLLLVPNLDTCFDLGLISFADDGGVLVSCKLGEGGREQLGIHTGLKLLKVDRRHVRYLAYHRAHVFQR